MPWIDLETIVKNNYPTEREKRQVEEFARRKAKARFYADENFPAPATAILRTRKLDVLTAQDVRKAGQPDENHASEARRLKRVLITCDRDYLDERRFQLIHCPTIAVRDFGKCSMIEIANTLRCLGVIVAVPQFFEKWTKIDARQDGWTQYSRHLDGTTSRSRNRLHRGRMQEWVEAGQ
jgi:predicted nuclease of predicted toxin-antitoxin system